MTEAAERELLGLFVRGDHGALETLFARYQREVYHWVLRIVRDTAEAEDLTVETFWRIYLARARFDPRRSFGAWARRIATRVALNRLRARRRRHEPLRFEPVARPTADPVEREDLGAAVAAALAELTPKLRLVATLALVEEVSYEEIAEALGLSRGAVKSRVFRAVRRLRRTLKEKGIEP